ncbi:teichoic acid export ATP-binding protein TagH [Halalkalibacter wakoensis JCM 9140]|uniref:Teichoic acid export ATP-binding protein TagH n=1 Tax=Halalkalibacter wakoensis JCM 9140 TaxID=1236970 RepID=W4Q3F4_9BACI|nr:teichoic acid export ATP-binding protein TagH [Halalkalibacter wakoensis JCM 9140]
MHIEDKNSIVVAKNVGVSFTPDNRSDDFKSHVFNKFKRKNENEVKGQFWPLKSIDFTGYEGEVLGIIGSNGSGKTTLCKLISGILHPDEGEIQVDGTVSALFSLGIGFNKELTGRENVYMSGMMLGIDKVKISQFIDEIHEFSGIGSFMEQPIKYYSSGMKARLGFSVAAFLEPEVLVLDEALNTGDIEFNEKAASKMKELVKKAKMVILVTHSIKYAVANCDRLIWLEKGVIKANGNPEEVAQQYLASVPKKKQKPKKKLDIKKTELKSTDKVAIKAENLSVTYNLNGKTFSALKNVNFEIKEGEVVGIIGHNGAGKSTLCKLMTNILTPDKGVLTINGETTALLGFGTGFDGQLSGRDNIYLNGMLLGIPKKEIEEHYDSIVEFSGLRKSINKPVKNYSSGMKSRLV